MSTRIELPPAEAANPQTRLNQCPADSTLASGVSRASAATSATMEDRPARRTRFIAARFVMLYVLLYSFPFPLNLLPGVGTPVDEAAQAIWERPVRWLGWHLFQLKVALVQGGSGDTTWNYVQVLCIAAIAGIGAVLWSAAAWSHRRRDGAGRGRGRDARLFDGVRVYAAFVLAGALLSYGAVKLVPSQFPPPALEVLLGRYADASRMSLLWTFIGSSTPYELFCGIIETLAGLLLTFRRTRLLGALLAMGAMTNVVLLNFAYDLPVKLYSSHLLALAVLVALPDLGPLARFFVGGQRLTRTAHSSGPLLARPWLNRTIGGVRTLLVLAYFAGELREAQQTRRIFALAPVPAVYGVWQVEEFATNGTPRPPLLTDSTRWWHLCFDHIPLVSVQTADQKFAAFLATYDEPSGTITLSDFESRAPMATLHYTRPRPDELDLTGILNGQPITAKAHRVELATLKLNRPMRWVHENTRRPAQ